MSSSDPETHASTALSAPLRLGRIFLEKVWGGRSLERVPGIELEGDGPIGETWELVDRTDHNSVVRGGEADGEHLRDLMATDRESLLGASRPTAEGRFPVLIKYLSASEPLSVQVHPNDAIATKLGAGDCGKTESWYILDAEPGSLVYLGLRPEVDPSELCTAAGGPGVVDALRAWPVTAGQFVHVPAGTLHAIGAGITLVEVQQNSDVTYRLYDWGRVGLDGKPRETHVNECLLATNYDEPVTGPVDPALESLGGDNHGARLVDTEHYGLGLFEVGSHIDLDTAGQAQALVLLEGTARLRLPDAVDPLLMERGDTWLVPATIGTYRLESTEGIAKVLVVDTKA